MDIQVDHMKQKYLSTTDVARALGVHPNTVRLYEKLGFLPSIARAKNNYRLFTMDHITQMRLAREALVCTWLGGDVRKTALDMVYLGAGGERKAALECAYKLLALVRSERTQAEAAAEFVELWAQGAPLEVEPGEFTIGAAASLLKTTVDALRNWERNGLLRVPRNPRNGYRLYGSIEIGRARVIRMLVLSGYSQMAILRMLLRFDSGLKMDLGQILDTPRSDEDVIFLKDRWLTTLADMERHAQSAVDLLELT